MGLEHGFLGIAVGRETEADMRQVPGFLWGEVEALGTAVEPGSDVKVDLAFAQIDALMHGHNGTEHEGAGHTHHGDSEHHHDHTHGVQGLQARPALVKNRAQRRAAGGKGSGAAFHRH